MKQLYNLFVLFTSKSVCICVTWILEMWSGNGVLPLRAPLEALAALELKLLTGRGAFDLIYGRDMLNKKVVGLITLVVLVLGVAGQALAVSEGPNNGGTFADDPSVGTVAWYDHSYAQTSNDTYAYTGLGPGAITYYLKATDFSFTIPTGATINGILVEVERKTGMGLADRIKDYSVRIVKEGVIGGDDKADAVNFWPGSDAYKSYGSTSDLWGLLWTPANINSADFGFVISATAVYNEFPFIDHIRVTVYYSLGITISGTIYTDEAKSANVGTGVAVGLSVNGAAKTTTTTTAGGAFSFSSVTVSANHTITLFIDDHASYEAELISQAVDGSTNITGLEMYTNKIVLRHETSGPMTNTLLATADNSGDDDIHYTISGSNVDFADGYEVWIDTGKTYTPGGTVEADDLEVSGTGTFNPAANAVTIHGSWTNSGTFTAGTSTVNLNGSSPQTMMGASTFYNLTTNNTTGVVLANDQTVSNTLTLTSGKITLGLNNLTLGASATISGTPSASNMIVAEGSGELRKQFTGTGSFTFPVGDNTGTAEYSPVTLNFTGGTFASAYAGVKLVNAKHPTNTSGSDYIKRYWTVTQSGISGFACNADFVYADGDVVGTQTNLVLGQLTTQWNVVGMVNPGTNTLYTTTGLTSFSDFTGGEAAALPIQLASFVGNFISNGTVQLEWTTISEINNFGFYVERRAASEEQFTTVSDLIPGAGYTLEPQSYSYLDENVSGSEITYRLLQVDCNGFENFSNPITIMMSPTGIKDQDIVPAVFSLNQNYPNPFNPSTIINYQLAIDNYTTLKVYNLIGKEVATLVSGYQTAGSHQVTFDGSQLTSGMYFYKLQSGSNVEVRKLILLR